MVSCRHAVLQDPSDLPLPTTTDYQESLGNASEFRWQDNCGCFSLTNHWSAACLGAQWRYQCGASHNFCPWGLLVSPCCCDVVRNYSLVIWHAIHETWETITKQVRGSTAPLISHLQCSPGMLHGCKATPFHTLTHLTLTTHVMVSLDKDPLWTTTTLKMCTSLQRLNTFDSQPTSQNWRRPLAGAKVLQEHQAVLV